ncbi:YncE family protein [Nonomuraea sp. NPDC050547]|uniref:YncE family protein n=1 Tax=Nonomuraea sp. NPDC050547 TaxID=3364368 RepID=UPI0037975B08
MRTTRRELLAGGLALATLPALSACAASQAEPAAAKPVSPPPPARTTGLAGTLYASTASGLVAVDLATGKQIREYGEAVPDAGWERLHQVKDGRLRVLDLPSGKVRREAPVSGTQVKAVSRSGELVAVGPPPGPRTSTLISLAGPDGGRDLRLGGNVEPEAFSTDGQVMYVLEYLPPDKPDRYRVRVLDLPSGTPKPLNTRDKKPVPEGREEEMRGQGRQAVLDADAGVLYTLYTHQPDHLHTRDLIAGGDSAPGVHAFVHVLQLDQRWAYCLDLPQPFGLGPPKAHTLALSPDGRTLFVYDATSGRIAQADTTDLTVKRTAFGAKHTGEAYALADDQHLYLAAGTSLQLADPATLAPRGTWQLPGPARGLATLNGQLLAGVGDRVIALDEKGTQQAGIPVPGLRSLHHAAHP